MRTARLQSLPVIGTLLLSVCPAGLLVAQTVSPGDRVRVHLDEVQLVMSGAGCGTRFTSRLGYLEFRARHSSGN